MTWTAYHRRGEVLRAVLDALDERPDGSLPWDLPGVPDTFVDRLDLVAALQLKWHTRLAGRIDAALGDEPLDLEEAVVSAWAGTAATLPGLRRLLDHHLAHPVDDDMARALDRATAKERVLLAVMAGRASVGDWSAAPIGAKLEQRARGRHAASSQIDVDGGAIGSAPDAGTWGNRSRALLERLRALVAA